MTTDTSDAEKADVTNDTIILKIISNGSIIFLLVQTNKQEQSLDECVEQLRTKRWWIQCRVIQHCRTNRRVLLPIVCDVITLSNQISRSACLSQAHVFKYNSVSSRMPSDGWLMGQRSSVRLRLRR